MTMQLHTSVSQIELILCCKLSQRIYRNIRSTVSHWCGGKCETALMALLPLLPGGKGGDLSRPHRLQLVKIALPDDGRLSHFWRCVDSSNWVGYQYTTHMGKCETALMALLPLLPGGKGGDLSRPHRLQLVKIALPDDGRLSHFWRCVDSSNWVGYQYTTHIHNHHEAPNLLGHRAQTHQLINKHLDRNS